MSFITKRERVFNEYDLFDLPARNEGKLKAYASCTDARAWSHFCSDKSEHLVEIIKRNNEICRPIKYVPTEAIVNTLLAHKHAEIARLKRKIEEFEQMLAAYDDLELTPDQKIEISKAHASIKEANKDLNELWFDLDLSGFTGIDSDGFETGKSGGDEPSFQRLHPPSMFKQELDESHGEADEASFERSHQSSKYKHQLDEDGDADKVLFQRYSHQSSKFKQDLNDETPRSKRDEWSFEKELIEKESKCNQASELKCVCDASTNAEEDPRILELQKCILTKDAKLNALRNTNAVIENDVCEPYCIYAHIYTAIEKIMGVLCQNDKYKLYLSLMTAGKDIRCIDIKGKILFKLKVLEKFTLALLAPCSKTPERQGSEQDCSCYRAEIVASVDPSYVITSSETQHPTRDNKRAQLVADIMENEEMKEILNKDSASFQTNFDEEEVQVSFTIDQENIKRLKNLQENYDDLMNCYEALKHEKDCLQIRCQKYDELEIQFESVKSQLREYNALWNEKEHYRKRSSDLDTLKEQYMVLCDETTSLETQLKAEIEINEVKTETIDELRSNNIELEKKINDASIAFEKERNSAQCKLKESECTIMCQGQQIKSLSVQIDRLLEQDPDKLQPKQPEQPVIVLIDEINSLKEQIKNLQDALFCSEEEKQQLQNEYQNKLNLINDIKMEIEDWKSKYDYLEKYTENFRDEVQKLLEENTALSRNVEDKSNAIDNLINVINNKSQEVNKLMEEIDIKNKENSDLYAEISSLHDSYNKNISALKSEKSNTERSLHIARRESQELLEKVKSYDDLLQKQDELSHLYEKQNKEYNQLQALLNSTQQENETLHMKLTSSENKNSNLLQEIKRLQDVHNVALSNISLLQDEKYHYKLSLELTKKDSQILEDKLFTFEDLSHQMQQLKESYQKLDIEKGRLENELVTKTLELDDAINAINLTKKVSEELEDKLKNSENLKANLKNIDDAYRELIKEKQRLQSEIDKKTHEFNNLLESYNNLENKLKEVNDQTSEKIEGLSRELERLKYSYNELLDEKNVLQNNNSSKVEENNNLLCAIENKIDENTELTRQLQLLELNHKTLQNSMSTLQEEHYSIKNTLHALKKESNELIHKINNYKTLELEYEQLKKEHYQVKEDKNKLQTQLNLQIAECRKISEDNEALHCESQHLLSHSELLEKALINARSELISNTSTENLHKNILEEIEDMRREKIANNAKIRSLLDQLEKSEIVMSDLNEDILARDDKIAILENYVNQLQDEVRRLDNSLAKMVDTGEQIKDNSYKKIRESISSMEAHHSKATHNMKMELAKLQHDNIKLEESLSTSQFKIEDAAQIKHKYISQIIDLQNEREIIVTDIKQLEIKSVGDSLLSPDNCDVGDILGSIDRIRQYLDDKNFKSTSLEQTLQKVQNSYQVVQSKADEAKKIVEKEKQKILNEKEEAIKDRLSMEKQLTNLREQLENQASHDRNIIKDLEAEILNQRLIIDKLNNSTQSYILKLEKELQCLQELYQRSLENISELEKKLQLMSEKNDTHLDIIKKINIMLEEKSKEIDVLNKELEILKNKPNQSLGTQAFNINNNNEHTQTNEEFLYEGFDQHNDPKKMKNLDEKEDFNENKDYNPIHSKKQVILEKKTIHGDKTKQTNEVQVLIANVDPNFKNNYLKFKIKNLSLGRLEQHSISCINEGNRSQDDKEVILPIIAKSDIDSINQSKDNMNVIDIYNKQSMHTNSSKVINSNYLESERNHKSLSFTSPATELDIATESLNTKNSLQKASNLFGSGSELSTDKDIFIIYKESETNESYDAKWKPNGHSEILVEAVTVHLKNDGEKNLEDEDLNEEDNVKRQLKINVPRVENDSPTLDTISDIDKKSLDSYTMNLYPAANFSYSSSDHKMEIGLKTQSNKQSASSERSISNVETQYLESHESIEDEKKRKRDINNFNIPSNSTQINELTDETSPTLIKRFENKSHHRLSRIDADVHLIKSKTAQHNEKSKSNNFGLDYILDSIRKEPHSFKTYSAADSLRKTHSNELFDSVKSQRKNDMSSSRLNELKKSSTDNKTIYINNQSSINNNCESKTNKEKSVLVKLDPIEEYEKQISYLTNNLLNIEKDYKKKIKAIKMQYDSNIKSILNEHNEGVKSIQSLHEETVQDMIKHHENEVENLRSMSIEAMRKAEKLEKEIRSLKSRIPVGSSICLNEEPTKISTTELKKHRKSRVDTKTLTKTNVEAFNVRPKSRSNGPCTCSLDINISDTIRNIFQQVDADKKKVAEHTYLKYILNKMLNNTVEALNCEELSFLHLKVCRTWKVKSSKEETLQKKIDSLETELFNKQRHNQRDITKLDRKVSEERRRLQEAREAVFQPMSTRCERPDTEAANLPSASNLNADLDFLCSCNPGTTSQSVSERQSAGDLDPLANVRFRPKRVRPENRAVHAKLDAGERREKKFYSDEPPTRLRRQHDRQSMHTNKK